MRHPPCVTIDALPSQAHRRVLLGFPSRIFWAAGRGWGLAVGYRDRSTKFLPLLNPSKRAALRKTGEAALALKRRIELLVRVDGPLRRALAPRRARGPRLPTADGRRSGSPPIERTAPTAEPSNDPPPVTIEGHLVALGPLRRDLLPTYQRWHNDVATSRTYALPLPTTIEQEEASGAALTAAPVMAFFTVYEGADWRPIGTAYLTNIDRRHRGAEFGILLGERDRRGRGYGTEATQLGLAYAFGELVLHNVLLTVSASNLAGRRAYERAGFRACGRR